MAEPAILKNNTGNGSIDMNRRFEALPEGAQREILRTARQAGNLNSLLNRTEERIFWDGAPWEAPVYDRDNPRRRDGRYRTRNGQVLPSEYERRQSIINRAVQNRLNRIRSRYNL